MVNWAGVAYSLFHEMVMSQSLVQHGAHGTRVVEAGLAYLEVAMLRQHHPAC